MTFCHECGKAVIPPSAKFCRNCGAWQWEEAQLPITPENPPLPESAPEALPVPGNTPPLPQSWNTPPSQVPLEPVIPIFCKSCNSPIHADEKYCGICGSPAGKQDPTLIHEPEIPTSSPAGVCISCGSPLFETAKFCGICGAGKDSVVRPDSWQHQPPQPALVKVCRSCGGPLSGTELFCGICGIPIQSAPPGLPASQPQAGKTCSNCGKPIRATTRFCGACGMAVGSK
jgi:predicted amidophosphoribosyltransferase